MLFANFSHTPHLLYDEQFPKKTHSCWKITWHEVITVYAQHVHMASSLFKTFWPLSLCVNFGEYRIADANKSLNHELQSGHRSMMEAQNRPLFFRIKISLFSLAFALSFTHFVSSQEYHVDALDATRTAFLSYASSSGGIVCLLGYFIVGFIV